MATMTAVGADYPVQVDIDGPQPQNRLSVLLRLIFAIPIIIVAAIVSLVAIVMTVIAWIVILVTGKYPEGMVNFVTGAWRLSVASQGYCWLLTDKYPAFSPSEAGTGDYPIRPAATVAIEGRNRLSVLLRIIFAIPHLIVLYVLNIAGQIVALISWFAALFTGSVPEGLHTFLAGWQRWTARVNAYMLLLTDEYPPFSLS
jgi:hypothetical protein